jgi:hypothetical protein
MTKKKGRTMQLGFLANGRSLDSPVWVSGQDIDRGILMGLTAGDAVLVEVDGKRLFTGQRCPVLVEEAWVIEIHIAGEELVLRYEDQLLHLLYKTVINQDPIVFYTHIKWYNSKKCHVILQLPGYRSTVTKEKGKIPLFDMDGLQEVLKESNAREALVARIWLTIRRLSADGWQQGSVNRFALVSGVEPGIIHTFRDKCEINDKNLVKVVKGMTWFRHLLETTGRQATEFAV